MNDASDVVQVERPALAILAEEEVTTRENLTRQREEALDQQRRHATWLMMFGLGPGALLAVGLAMISGRPELVWPFVGLGAGVQIWRIWKEHRRIRKLEKDLVDPFDGS
jgi:hypothetical protein